MDKYINKKVADLIKREKVSDINDILKCLIKADKPMSIRMMSPMLQKTAGGGMIPTATLKKKLQQLVETETVATCVEKDEKTGRLVRYWYMAYLDENEEE
jgi:transcription initiation factor IIE alpha subunit